MKVLVACEFSGIVRDAFRARGHDAWSCDILPCEKGPAFHRQCDIRSLLGKHPLHRHEPWDLMIAHPPCTFLTVAANKWTAIRPERAAKVEEALAFVRFLMDAPIPRIAIENPVSVISGRIRPPDQTFQPWQFGHGEVKRTCLWLKNLPPLIPTAEKQMALGVTHKPVTSERSDRLHRMAPGPDRWRERSRTFTGIAEAMAEQWGAL